MYNDGKHDPLEPYVLARGSTIVTSFYGLGNYIWLPNLRWKSWETRCSNILFNCFLTKQMELNLPQQSRSIGKNATPATQLPLDCRITYFSEALLSLWSARRQRQSATMNVLDHLLYPFSPITPAWTSTPFLGAEQSKLRGVTRRWQTFYFGRDANKYTRETRAPIFKIQPQLVTNQHNTVNR